MVLIVVGASLFGAYAALDTYDEERQLTVGQIELSADDVSAGLAERFLEACEVSETQLTSAVEQARTEVERVGSAIVQVRFGTRGLMGRLNEEEPLA